LFSKRIAGINIPGHMTTLTHRLILLLAIAGGGSLLPSQVFRPPQVRSPKSPGLQAFTVGADEPGCKDSALLQRVAGCSILQCEADTATTAEVITALNLEGVSKKEEFEGAAETIYYLCPSKVTHASIVASAEARFVKDGYKVVARSQDGDEEPLISAVNGRQWVQITTYTYENSSAYVQTTLLADPEEQIDAATVEQELAKSGRVALTGLKFDKDAIVLPAGAEQLFADLAVLLAKKPEWKIRIEANCDESVDSAACKSLGEKRAEAVAGTLVAKGVDKGRLTASPLSAPPAEDEDRGRAHVQLVKY
jgi:outer membrane protein OmpA-like peptidoglycan-associated protein